MKETKVKILEIDVKKIQKQLVELGAEDEKTVLSYAAKLCFSKEECKNWTGTETYTYYLENKQ
jgi:hypothetical protein